jgi:hypothetical protein
MGNGKALPYSWKRTVIVVSAVSQIIRLIDHVRKRKTGMMMTRVLHRPRNLTRPPTTNYRLTLTSTRQTSPVYDSRMRTLHRFISLISVDIEGWLSANKRPVRSCIIESSGQDITIR